MLHLVHSFDASLKQHDKTNVINFSNSSFY